MNVKFKILGLVLLVTFGLFGCLPEQDLADPISPEGYGYAKATFTTDFTGNTISEGDTLIYTITLDRMLDRALNFSLEMLDGTADDMDITWNTVVIPPYTLEAEFPVIINADDVPENGETIKFEIGVFGLADKYLLEPTTVNPVLDLNITNVNWDGGVTIAFGWENPDEDFDIFSIGEVVGDWNLAGTANNPEIMQHVWNEDDDDTYWFTVDPYHVEGETSEYLISIGFPDQTVAFVEGTFDYTNRDTEYPIRYFAYWDINTYELANVVKNGGIYTVYTYDGTLVATGSAGTTKSIKDVVVTNYPIKK